MGEAKRVRDSIKAKQDRSEREDRFHKRAQVAEGDLLKAQAEIARLNAEVERLQAESAFLLDEGAKMFGKGYSSGSKCAHIAAIEAAAELAANRIGQSLANEMRALKRT